MEAKRPNMGLPALQAKVDKLTAEVQADIDAIRAAHVARDAELDALQDREDAAFKEKDERLKKQADVLAYAQKVQADGDSLIEQGRDKHKEALQLEESAKAMDLGDADIKAAKHALIDCRCRWADKLSQLQDGATRRKLAQLERLQARLERRKQEEQRTPQDYGTPEGREALAEDKKTRDRRMSKQVLTRRALLKAGAI